jgi:hypothetical protein
MSISPSLDEGSNHEPKKLTSNSSLSSTGFLVYGAGFVIDPHTAKQMLEHDVRNRQAVQPLLSASDITDNPRTTPSAFVINFGSMPEEAASKFDMPFKWLEEHAKADRLKASREDAKIYWWKLVGRAERFFETAKRLRISRVLVNVRVSTHLVFCFVNLHWAFESDVNAFAFDTDGAFATLQSTVHDVWAAKRGSTLGLAPRYTPTTCFEAFPFPENWQIHPGIEAAGKAYYEFRAGLMVRNNGGLTKTYNRFHDPDERDPEILKLRELHAAMDRAVLDAYGWSDVKTGYEFLLDYEIDEEEWGGKKKPWRYRWPDEVRDEVLARLLELNANRAKEETRSGTSAGEKVAKKVAAKPAPKPSDMEDLLS